MTTLQSLRFRKHTLADKSKQVQFLNDASLWTRENFPKFKERLKQEDSHPEGEIYAAVPETLLVNLGYMCNQVCAHCHVDAGPDRKEMMTHSTLDLCLELLRKSSLTTLDITGGAPEMHPEFRNFVKRARQKEMPKDLQIIVRCNLTIIVSHPKYEDLPDFFKKHKIRIISSLPCYTSENTDRQRGDGVFAKSIQALQKLNAVGYGQDNSDLKLDLLYNPVGALLPSPQARLEEDYKRELKKNYGIVFNQLFTLTNMPISRFLEFLIETRQYEKYMLSLIETFDPQNLDATMCNRTISVDYKGYLYDCDFNQMLDLPLQCTTHSNNKPKQKKLHLSDILASTTSWQSLTGRSVQVSQHCYGCTSSVARGGCCGYG